MTTPPLPDHPTLRVNLVYTHDTGLEAGGRFFLRYSGSAPTGANCASLASGIATAWNTDLSGVVNPDWGLKVVDVLDITTLSGASGIATVAYPGTASGTAMPAQTAMGVEYQIARRYRGGKPRMYLPPAVTSQVANDTQWLASWVTAVTTSFTSFMTAVTALSPGAIGTLNHVNVSYYSGFTNVTNTSGRTRAAPKYRSSALTDLVTGYQGKQEISSQRRRRTSTTA